MMAAFGPFWAERWVYGLWLAFVAAFAVLDLGIALSGGQRGERGVVGCVQSRKPGMCWPSGVYSACKLQWHFTCGFHFRHRL